MVLDNIKELIDQLSHDEATELKAYLQTKLSASHTVKLGIIADMHGDYESFQKAIEIFDSAGVIQIVCAGDIVDRGSDADKIIDVIVQRGIICCAGNHDRTVVANQDRWRQHKNQQRMRQLGRIVSDEAIAFLTDLPDSTSMIFADKRILVAHGTPWSDVLGAFPDSRQSTFDRIYRDYSTDYDIIIIGHTHQPMHVMTRNLHIINPGSVYSITARDSNTCAILSMPDYQVTLYDLASGKSKLLDVTNR